MLHESAEIYLKESDLAIEAEELVIFQFVIFSFEFCYLSFDNHIFTPPMTLKTSFAKIENFMQHIIFFEILLSYCLILLLFQSSEPFVIPCNLELAPQLNNLYTYKIPC